MKQETLKLIQEKYEKADLKYHINAVVKNAMLLASKLKADIEVVEMGAYLHDIGRTEVRDRDFLYYANNDHHIVGEKVAGEFLKNLGYDTDFIEKVCHCVLTHRGRKGPNPETIEAEIIANADAMAHFDTFLDIFNIFLKTNKTFEKAVEEIEAKMNRNWNKKLTLPEAKKISKEKYEAIMLIIKSTKEYMN